MIPDYLITCSCFIFTTHTFWKRTSFLIAFTASISIGSPTKNFPKTLIRFAHLIAPQGLNLIGSYKVFLRFKIIFLRLLVDWFKIE